MRQGTWHLAFYKPTRSRDALGGITRGKGEAIEAWAIRLGDGAVALQGSEVRTIYAETRWVVNKWGLEEIKADWTFTELGSGNSYEITGVQDRKGSERDQFLIRAVRRDTQRTPVA